MPYIIAIVTLLIFTSVFHLVMNVNIIASFFVGLVWAAFTGITILLWQRGWYAMSDKNHFSVFVNIIIYGAALIGVTTLTEIPSSIRLLLQFMVFRSRHGRTSRRFPAFLQSRSGSHNTRRTTVPVGDIEGASA